MGIMVDTAGDFTYTIPNCDCGLTGGCEKCQPNINGGYRYKDFVSPIPHEEMFMDENLKEFYRKKGLLYNGEATG